MEQSDPTPPSGGLLSQIGNALLSNLTVILSLVTVIIGIVQFSETQREEVRSQYRTAVLSAAQQQYTAELGAVTGYLAKRDIAYADTVSAGGDYVDAYVNGNDDPGNPVLKVKQEAFSHVLYSELTMYAQSDDEGDALIENAGTMLYFHMIFIGTKDPLYEQQIKSLWNAQDGPLDFNQPHQVLDALYQHLDRVIGQAIRRESDPSTYPSVQGIMDQIIADKPKRA